MELKPDQPDRKQDLLGSPEKKTLKLKKEKINGFVQYKIDGDSIIISKQTFSVNKITYVKVVKETRHRMIFVGELSSEDKLKETSKFIDSLLSGI
jgi:hypothetical protein